MKRLISGQEVALDDDDWPPLAGLSWTVTPHGSRYVRATVRGRRVYMHRLIMAAGRGQEIDHIDGNGLNNQRSNLRFVTRAQNTWNARGHGGTSRYKGVSKNGRKWSARIMLDGKDIYLGTYATEPAAALAYDEAAIRLFGPYARTND